MKSLKFIIFQKSAEFGILNASYINQMGLVARKSVFRISEKLRFKQACSATETS